MHVIQAKAEEQLRDAYAIRKKVFVEEQHVPIEIELDEHDANSSHFVLYDGDLPVGAGRFRIIDGIGKVERICILPAYRGKGAGLKIMQKMEEFARSLHIEELVLNSQTSAIPFYKKQGYVIVSEEFFDAGIPHRTMKKTIKHKLTLDS